MYEDTFIKTLFVTNLEVDRGEAHLIKHVRRICLNDYKDISYKACPRGD